jgi:hypothetical protein
MLFIRRIRLDIDNIENLYEMEDSLYRNVEMECPEYLVGDNLCDYNSETDSYHYKY